MEQELWDDSVPAIAQAQGDSWETGEGLGALLTREGLRAPPRARAA